MDLENYKALVKEISAVNARLVAVSKQKTVAEIELLYDEGQRLFGENKVQELVPKYEALPKDIEWHFVGHLQSNKVKQIAPFISLIHSVDSLKLLIEIDKEAQKNERIINCLLQVYIAAEETKFGLSDAELMELIRNREFINLKNIRICGLMGMATNTANGEQVKKEFTYLKNLFQQVRREFFWDKVYFSELSMGMSADYKIALQCGATLIRLGSVIFGEG
jgi:pyridoxal phosphate enzyme (YggS family)